MALARNASKSLRRSVGLAGELKNSLPFIMKTYRTTHQPFQVNRTKTPILIRIALLLYLCVKLSRNLAKFPKASRRARPVGGRSSQLEASRRARPVGGRSSQLESRPSGSPRRRQKFAARSLPSGSSRRRQKLAARSLPQDFRQPFDTLGRSKVRIDRRFPYGPGYLADRLT